MFGIKSFKTAAMLTLIFFICFMLSSDFSFSKDKNPREQKKSEIESRTGEKTRENNSVEYEAETIVSYQVIEKPGDKNKKKKKKFPWLLVIGATLVIGVVLYLILKKNKSDGSKGSIKVESSPTDAGIWLDGSDTGKKTNTTLKNISPGAHTIRFVKAGYWDIQRVVQVEAGKETLVNETLLATTVEWIYIPAGEFTMGYYYVDNVYFIYDSKPYMEPPHKVYLDDYYISKYEITFEEYDKFCDETGHGRSSDFGWGRGTRPVIDISYNDAIAYCNWISEKTGMNIHLPTEAQWEKAARGTDERFFPWGGGIPPRRNFANFFTHMGKTLPVGSYPLGISPYGVHDMAGNATEWCQDWFGYDYYKVSPYRNPQGPAAGTYRVKRGGDWKSHPNGILSTWRLYEYPSKPHRLGFRVAREVE